jgi:SARP family transcriptional regulator, regulator of embCAB operon
MSKTLGDMIGRAKVRYPLVGVAITEVVRTSGQTPLLQERGLCLSLLGGFCLACETTELALPRGSERLIALLAIGPQARQRSSVAGVFWPDSDERHAQASLRSALARINGTGFTLIDATSSALHLVHDLDIDIVHARSLARRILEGTHELSDLSVTSVTTLSLELLPDWYDEWVVHEAEDWRQLRLHALESLAGLFTDSGRYPEAIAAAVTAVKGDPLRESARMALVRAHSAENNQSEAIREFQRYRQLLDSQLGLEPSRDFATLMGIVP